VTAPLQPPIADRDTKPNNTVELVWHEERDLRRLQRVADILADILDNQTTPAEPAKP
jgi:hypothetical protein